MKYDNEVVSLQQDTYHAFFLHDRSKYFHLQSGKVYAAKTLDNLGFDENMYRASDDLNPLSGPYCLKGVKAGDVLVINILDVNITRDVGLSSQGILPEFIGGQYGKPVLGEDIVFWAIEDGCCHPVVGGKTEEFLAVKQELMVGCIRCSDSAEERECLSSTTADRFGGNLDCKLIKKSSTVFLPVTHDDALFYLGDIHFNQGFGEVGGTGIEVSSEVVFSVEICEKPKSRELHVDVEGVTYFFGVNDDFHESVRTAYTCAFEALVGSDIDELIVRLVLGHDAPLIVMKLGSPNVVVVGVASKYFTA